MDGFFANQAGRCEEFRAGSKPLSPIYVNAVRSVAHGLLRWFNSIFAGLRRFYDDTVVLPLPLCDCLLQWSAVVRFSVCQRG